MSETWVVEAVAKELRTPTRRRGQTRAVFHAIADAGFVVVSKEELEAADALAGLVEQGHWAKAQDAADAYRHYQGRP